MSDVENIIQRFGLQPLEPEGGYFSRTWTASNGGDGTAIYFLLTSATFSAFHRLKADEIWHFYAGDPVEHWQLQPGREPLRVVLGNELLGPEPEQPQLVVPAQIWQGARLAPPANNRSSRRGWALLGCTLCPGWRDQGFFELGSRADLCQAFPDASPLVVSLTR